MKIHPRYYPAIIIAAYVIFLLIGLLLGFGPDSRGGGHGRGALLPSICLTLEILA